MPVKRHQLPGVAGTSIATRILWGPLSGIPLSNAISMQTTVLNDLDNSVAIIFQAPVAGTLNQIGIGVNTFTGAPPAYNVGFVTLDGSQNPTATAAGTSTILSYTPTATGWFWLTMATGLTVTAGQTCCARIWPGATIPTATNSITVRKCSNVTPTSGMPQVLEWLTAWNRVGNMPIAGMAARYTGGRVCGGLPCSGTTGQPDGPTFNSVSASPEHGAVFSVPVNMTVEGLRFTVDPATDLVPSATFCLYDSTSTLLGSWVQPPSMLAVTGNNVIDVQLVTPVSLAAGATYRMSMIAFDVENRNIPALLPPDTDSKNAIPEGSRWSYTSRPSAGAWTDVTLTVPLFGLWVTLIS